MYSIRGLWLTCKETPWTEKRTWRITEHKGKGLLHTPQHIHPPQHFSLLAETMAARAGQCDGDPPQGVRRLQ